MPTTVPRPSPSELECRSAPVGERRGPRARAPELVWRLIVDGHREGATNMALDHALAECLAEDEAVVRLYGWDRPTVSFGKNEPASASDPRLAYVRRPTGGRAVLHDDELTYAVVAPIDAFGGLREAYLTINRALADGVRSLGVAADIAGDENAAPGISEPLDAGACFRTPARGEIVAAGRKLVGSAQARIEGALLQHGSILIAGDQARLGEGAGDPVTLVELLGDVTRVEVQRAMVDAMRGRFGGAWKEGTYRPRELDAADRLRSGRYGLDTWTWRKRREQT